MKALIQSEEIQLEQPPPELIKGKSKIFLLFFLQFTGDADDIQQIAFALNTVDPGLIPSIL